MAFCAGKRMPPSSVNSYLWPLKARRNSGMCFIRSRANSTCMLPMGSFRSDGLLRREEDAAILGELVLVALEGPPEFRHVLHKIARKFDVHVAHGVFPI